MKGSVAVLDQINGRRAAALIVDGQLQDFLIDPNSEAAPVPGSIFRAICDRPLKGQGGMIVRLPDQSGYLRQGRGLRAGQALLVQVSGFAETGKAVPVTDRVLYKSKFAIVTPGAPGINVSRAIKDEEKRVTLLEIGHAVMASCQDAGLILRSAAENADPQAISNDIKAMHDIHRRIADEKLSTTTELLLDGPDAHQLAWRDWPQVDHLVESNDAFAQENVFEHLTNTFATCIKLAAGAFAFIEPTRALVAVDVNTGADTSPAASLKANIALAKDLPRLLRVRGLGGQVTVDFAPIPKRDRRALEQVLKSAFRKDAIDTALAGWTPLGHFELQRKRERLPVDPGEIK